MNEWQTKCREEGWSDTTHTMRSRVWSVINDAELQDHNKGVYFLFRTRDNDPREAWLEYCQIQERLGAVGLRIDNPCVEHDCVSGYLREAEE
jgi:hypothetical protein